MRRWARVAAGLLLAGTIIVPSPAQAAEAVWSLHDSNAAGGVEYRFGWGATGSCTPVTGDWDGNGSDTPGAVCPKSNNEWQWSLHNANTIGGVEHYFGWGSTTCQLVTGDWNGDGTHTPGTVCPKSNNEWQWSLHNANTIGGVEHYFGWGSTTCQLVTGDWNGDGTHTPGTACPVGTTWQWKLHDANAGGGVEHTLNWGDTACSPVAGDWDGNRTDTPGTVCARTDGQYQWSLHDANAPGGAVNSFSWGAATERAVHGDWNGDGTDTPGTTTLAPPLGRFSLPIPRSAAPRGEYDDAHHDYPAIDLAVPTGTHAYAVRAGTVVRINDNSCGRGINLTGTDGAVYTYCHFSNWSVASGATVRAGQLIGYTGNTGNSTGPHLHFAIRTGSTRRCPQNFLLAIYDGRIPPAATSLPTTGCFY